MNTQITRTDRAIFVLFVQRGNCILNETEFSTNFTEWTMARKDLKEALQQCEAPGATIHPMRSKRYWQPVSGAVSHYVVGDREIPVLVSVMRKGGQRDGLLQGIAIGKMAIKGKEAQSLYSWALGTLDVKIKEE